MTTDDALIYGSRAVANKRAKAKAAKAAKAKAAADKKKTKKKIHTLRSKRMGPHEYNPKGHRTVVGPHPDSKEAKSKAARKKKIASVKVGKKPFNKAERTVIREGLKKERQSQRKAKKKVDVHGKARKPVENRNVNPEYDATHESSSPGSQTDGWQAREAEKRLGR